MRSMMDSCLKLSTQDLRLYLFDEAQQPPRLFFVTTSFDSVVEIGYSNILLGSHCLGKLGHSMEISSNEYTQYPIIRNGDQR